jgi:hypothetical protein
MVHSVLPIFFHPRRRRFILSDPLMDRYIKRNSQVIHKLFKRYSNIIIKYNIIIMCNFTGFAA